MTPMMRSALELIAELKEENEALQSKLEDALAELHFIKTGETL